MNITTDILDKMNPDKKMSLINAAMKEFSENRFEKASTNTIVREAGISKGLLYHYFQSKEDLYEYLINFAINVIARPIAEEIGTNERDIIKRIQDISVLKMKVMNEFPAILPFSKVMYAGMDYEQVKAMIAKYNPIPIDNYYQSNIDFTLFREGINVELATKTIQYTLEGHAERIMTMRNMGLDLSMENMMEEFTSYLEHFRQTYYKEESHDKS